MKFYTIQLYVDNKEQGQGWDFHQDSNGDPMTFRRIKNARKALKNEAKAHKGAEFRLVQCKVVE